MAFKLDPKFVLQAWFAHIAMSYAILFQDADAARSASVKTVVIALDAKKEQPQGARFKGPKKKAPTCPQEVEVMALLSPFVPEGCQHEILRET